MGCGELCPSQATVAPGESFSQGTLHPSFGDAFQTPAGIFRRDSRMTCAPKLHIGEQLQSVAQGSWQDCCGPQVCPPLVTFIKTPAEDKNFSITPAAVVFDAGGTESSVLLWIDWQPICHRRSDVSVQPCFSAWRQASLLTVHLLCHHPYLHTALKSTVPSLWRSLRRHLL